VGEIIDESASRLLSYFGIETADAKHWGENVGPKKK